MQTPATPRRSYGCYLVTRLDQVAASQIFLTGLPGRGSSRGFDLQQVQLTSASAAHGSIADVSRLFGLG